MEDSVIFLVGAAHMFYTPFTKVEESFNLQAMHDILYLRRNFSEYDHLEFPGVVPRTFIGPLYISILSSPFVLLIEALGLNKSWTQYIVRLMLAGIVAKAWNKLRHTLNKLFHIEISYWFTVITITQFHFMFYMSRPLPNIMALPLVLYAVSYWLQGQMKPFIISSGIAVLVFRSELAIFLGLLLLFAIIGKKTTMDRVIKIGVPAGVAILATTVLVDSLFWQRLVWPEGEVLWFNTILNKSSNWGTSPFLWYFYSALPRAMGFTLLFVPAGIYLEPRIRPLMMAAIAFVFIYSFLPHKELRFIIYVVPVLNIAAAIACCRFNFNSAKSVKYRIIHLFSCAHLLLNLMLTLFLLVVSGTNYPGGVAISRLHRLEVQQPNVSVHICNAAAQSGVSRFLQIRPDWRYYKIEHLEYTQPELTNYTHLLMEAKTKQNTPHWLRLQENFDVLEYVDCFNSIGIQYSSLMPLRIKTKPCIAILKRKLGPFADHNTPEEEEESSKITKRDATAVEPEDSVLETASQPDPTVLNEEQDDGIVTNVEASGQNGVSVEQGDENNPGKEINFQELRNLALGGQPVKKTRATKLKIRRIIEQHYRSKGKQIENGMQQQPKDQDKNAKSSPSGGVKQSVKAIIKQERIKEMIEQIATMDLTSICDLEKVSTKECLKQVIDKLDEQMAK